jgi:hypothetical protein
MNETQSTILSEIQGASNKVHQQTMRGVADVIFVSRRVMDEIEDVLDEDFFQHHTIVEGSNFVGKIAPCDIRAMAQMGHSDFEVHDSEDSGIPEVELTYSEEEWV